MGEQDVKNIAQPVHAFAVSAVTVASLPEVAMPALSGAVRARSIPRLAVIAASLVGVIGIGAAVWWTWPKANSPAVPVQPPAAASTQQPSVPQAKAAPPLSLVVLPFANLSNDPEQEYFANGITDDLTTDLSRIPGSLVISRNTAFTYKGKPADVKQIGRDLEVRYVVEGSVRRTGDQVQVNVQLIDAETGVHRWADRFDTDRRNLVEAQSEITGRLARTLDIALVRDAGRRIEQAKAENLDASDLVMRARELQARPRAGKGLEALSAFEQALKLDPRSIDARLGIAAILTSDLADGYSTSVQQDEARAEKLLLEALDADPYRSYSHTYLGLLRRFQKRWGEARSELEMAIALDRNNSGAIRQLGMLLEFTGQPELAIPYVERSLRLNPREGASAAGIALAVLGTNYFFIGEVEKAIDLLKKAWTEHPKIFWYRLILAGALGIKGDIDEARSAIAESLKLKPAVNSVAAWRDWLVSVRLEHPQFLALMDKTVGAGLRRAGFPAE
jgi:adenylate cyclase